MAFTGATRALILRSALSVIRNVGANAQESEIVRRVIANNTVISGGTYQAYQGIVRTAQALSRAGAALTYSTGGALSRREHPTDSTIGPGNAEYRYRLAVTVYGMDGSHYTTSADLDSDNRLSHSQIQQIVENNLDSYVSDRRSARAAIASLGPTDRVSVVVISAGKRAP